MGSFTGPVLCQIIISNQIMSRSNSKELFNTAGDTLLAFSQMKVKLVYSESVLFFFLSTPDFAAVPKGKAYC